MAIDLLTAADAVAQASASSLPTQRSGTVLPARQDPPNSLFPGWSVFEAQARTIRVDALRWPRSVFTYEDMARDPQIQGLLMSVYLPIRHMEWYLDPAGAPESLVQETAEDFGLPLMGEETVDDVDGVDHDEHLRLALLALAGGHQFFEETGVIDGNGPAAKYRLRQLAQAPPETIQRISVTAGGDLLSIRLPAAHPEVDGPYVDVPADHLLAYVWDRRGADWAGRPLLYGLYRAWLLKDELVRGDVATKRRFGGIPVVEATDPNVGKKALEEAAKMAMLLQAGDGAGVSLPYGTRLRLLGVEGTIPDAIASAEYHDRQMARAFMQMFAELGNTKNGSRALGATLLDHYAMGVVAVADWLRKSQMRLVQRIAIRNYGPGTVLPQIRFRQDDHEDIAITDLVSLIDSGAIVVDDDLEATIRERGNLPKRNPSQSGRTPARAPVPAPAPATAASRSQRRQVAAATTAPTVGHRQPTAVEQQAGVDFEQLHADHAAAVAAIVAAWALVQAAQIAELTAQIAAATTLAGMMAATATRGQGTPAITAEMFSLAAAGAAAAIGEAAYQGHVIPSAEVSTPPAAALETAITSAVATARVQDAIDRAVEASSVDTLTANAVEEAVRENLQGIADQLHEQAQALDDVLSSGLEQSARTRLPQVASPDATPEQVADEVRKSLEDLSEAYVKDRANGAASIAQNSGRTQAMEGWGDGADFYSSELLDTNTCAPCAALDGSEYPSLTEAKRDYPLAGFLGCEGRDRCRGTVVAVSKEDA